MGRKARIFACGLAAVSAAATVAGPAQAGVSYSDVPKGYYADSAVRYVAEYRDWMRVPGSSFKPGKDLSRRLFTKAIVLAFARDLLNPPAPAPSPSPSPSLDPENPELVLEPTPEPSPEPVDPPLKFKDLPKTDWAYKYANVAVKLGWMTAPGGVFQPDAPVTKRVLARALVRALGLAEAVRGLNGISTTDGYRFKHSPWFGYLIIANELHLNYNFPTGSESKDLYPWDAVSRGYGAYALYKAARARSSWGIWAAQKYETIKLPSMTASRKRAIEFAFSYAGYPYVYAGEWYRKTPSGYCCGYQPQGGFDCSGFVWWVMKAPSGSWDPVPPRPYKGWSLGQRSSYEMARATKTRRSMSQLAPLDIVLFDTDGAGTGWRSVDHAGLYLGKGWMIHSSGSRGGVAISFIGDGWWKESFVWGRRLFSKYS